VLRFDNVSYVYPDREEAALHRVNFHLCKGDVLVVSGRSGCGKSTLARAASGILQPFYGGRLEGEIRLGGKPIGEWPDRERVLRVGMVFQDPEAQMVMTTVERELAFGMENLGIPSERMRRTVAEVAEMLELTDMLQRQVAILSGGFQQRVALGAVLALSPQVLVLDEPTSQLDPAAAERFVQMLEWLNRHWGMTMLVIEQHLDRVLPIADRVLFMDRGRVAFAGSKSDGMAWAARHQPELLPSVSSAWLNMLAANHIERTGAIPVTVKEAGELLRRDSVAGPAVWPADNTPDDSPQADRTRLGQTRTPTANRSFSGQAAWGQATPTLPNMSAAVPLVELEGVDAAYDKGKRTVLHDVSLMLYPGEWVALHGANGAGKSSLCQVINGLLRPVAGNVKIKGAEIRNRTTAELSGDVGYLPQNPNDYLFQPTVAEEIAYTRKIYPHITQAAVDGWLKRFELAHLLNVHPRDLSSGQRQRLALLLVLLPGPDVVMLDEPTRGMDGVNKEKLGAQLQMLQQAGKLIIMVTHDVEFAARRATRVIYLSRGRVVSDADARTFYMDSRYYTPAAVRLESFIQPFPRKSGYADGTANRNK
jgi:energy-coupling factor transport system ATP-binding protein